MAEIRCVGGYLDNVMVDDRGATFQVLDHLDYQKMAALPKGDPRLNSPMVYHQYTQHFLDTGALVYLHDKDCCATRTLKEFANG